MSKILQAFSLGIFYVWVLAITAQAAQSELQISLSTLKSDLDLILEDFASPRTVNIKYAESAILHVLVLPKLNGEIGRYAKVDGPLTIRQKKKPLEVRSALIYEDGSFDLPPNQDDTTHIIFKPNPTPDIKLADKTLTYIPLQELTNTLNMAVQNLGTKPPFPYSWSTYPLGTSYTKVAYSPADRRFHVTEPLKGISLYKGNKLNMNFKDLVRPETYQSIKGLGDKFTANFKQLTKPGGYKSLTRMLTPNNQQKNEMLNGVTHIVAKKQPDVFFDVWYDPKSKRYGSSSGSMAGVDAIRVYQEWNQDIFVSEKSVQTNLETSRAEYIRESIFEQDMYSAYMKLNSPDQTYKNAIINYANEIVLEVQPSGSGLGNRGLISVSGTSSADAWGNGLLNVKAFYDLNQLQYSSIVPEGNFVPVTYGHQTWYLKYSDWAMFERHLKAIWAAMQGGCTRIGKPTYDFSIFYGESIRVKYDCNTRSITLQDTISILANDPKLHKATTSNCNNLTYLPSQQVAVTCLSSGVPPIAIRQEPKNVWSTYDEVASVNTALLMDDMVALKETLTKNQKTRQNTPKGGAIILDGKVLVDMKLPNGPGVQGVEVYSFFSAAKDSSRLAGKNYQMLNFHGGYFSATGIMIPLPEMSASIDLGIGPHIAKDSHLFGSNYVTIKKLKQDLKKVSEEALKRCLSRKIKSFSFNLVNVYKFALRGFYDCSGRVFLFEGNFKALLLSNKNGYSEIRTFRIIDGFIYVEKDELFITESQSFDDVYAISVPEMSVLEASANSYGTPINIDTHTYVVLKSKDAR